MPIIIPANSAVGGGFDVANSLRFNSGSSDYLNRTFGTPTSSQTWTLSFWIKRCKIGSATEFVFNTDGGNEEDRLQFSSSDTLTWFEQNSSGGTVAELTTSQKFRDVSAWYHIVVARDSTQGTSSNRIKLYVNGSQVTALGTATYPSQNDSSRWNTGVAHEIGARNGGTFVNLYMSEVVFIDGQQLAPTSFGEVDSDSGIWKPKNVSGLTFGNNGFYLDFKDSSSLGNDSVGSNNWTANNFTAIDQTTDTCTNNFATLNPLIPFGGTFSEGNLQHTRSSSGYRSAVSSIGAKTGKWYVEIKSPDNENIGVGVINGDASSGLYMSGSEQFLGQHSYDAGYYFNGILYVGNSSQSGSWTSYTSNDIIGIALDADNGYVYFSKNGSFVNSGNPASGASGTGGYALSGIGSGGTYFIGCSTGNNSEHYVNFGNSIFSISSGNADGNGHGNFEYTVPSNYFALCTKNLAENS